MIHTNRLIIILAVIAAIVILQLAALAFGINGTVLRTTIAVIGGLGGYTLKGIVNRRKK